MAAMRSLFLGFLSFSFAGFLCAEPSPLLHRELPFLILRDGTTFHDATIIRIEPDAATIRHPGGISRIDLERFDRTNREAMGYDADAANEARRLRREQENRVVFAKIPSPYVSKISPADIVLPLSKMGFHVTTTSCDQKRKWVCAKMNENTEFEIEVVAPADRDRVSAVRCLAIDHFNLNVAIAAQPIFEELLTIVFENGDPAPAENWLSASLIEGNASTRFDGLRACLSSTSRNVRVLRILPGHYTFGE